MAKPKVVDNLDKKISYSQKIDKIIGPKPTEEGKKNLEDIEGETLPPIGMLACGGAATRITIATYSYGKPEGCGEALALDLDRDAPHHFPSSVTGKIIRATGVVTPTGGVYPLSQRTIEMILENRGSYDKEVVETIEDYVAPRAGGRRFNLIFLLVAPGGGSGSGISRGLLNHYSNISAKLVPCLILPDERSSNNEYYNTIEYFGYLKRLKEAGRVDFPTVLCIENKQLRMMAHSPTLKRMNKIVARCLCGLTTAFWHCIRQDKSYANIDRPYLALQTSKGYSVSTLGFGSSLFCGTGRRAVEKAFLSANTQNLLGINFRDLIAMRYKLKTIIFALVPNTLEAGIVKEVVKEVALKEFGDSNQILEVFVGSESHIRSIELIVWVAGHIVPPVLQSTIFSNAQFKDELEIRRRTFKSCIEKTMPASLPLLADMDIDFRIGYEYFSELGGKG